MMPLIMNMLVAYSFSEKTKEDMYLFSLIKNIKITYTTLFIIILFFTILVFYLFHILLLPIIFPDSQNGILNGDPQFYLNTSINLVNDIKSNSWAEWELRPNGEGVAGLFAIIFYIFGTNNFSIILFNAILHSISCILLIKIINEYFSFRISIIASLYYIISPYYMFWFSQPNKDSIVITGYFIFIYSLIRIWNVTTLDRNIKSRIALLVCESIFGVALIWIARPYLIQVLIFPLVLFIFAYFVRTLRANYNDYTIKNRYFIYKNSFISAIGIFSIFLIMYGTDSSSSKYLNSLTYQYEESNHVKWSETILVPDAMEKKIYTLISQRKLYYQLNDSENQTTKELFIDIDKRFINIIDVLVYSPKALLISLVYPLPNDWYMFTSSNKRSFFRLSQHVQMPLVYISLVGLLFLSRKVIIQYKNGLFIPLTFSTFTIFVYGLSIPHLAVLDRYRYAYLTMIMCIGLAFVLEKLIVKIQARELSKNNNV